MTAEPSTEARMQCPTQAPITWRELFELVGAVVNVEDPIEMDRYRDSLLRALTRAASAMSDVEHYVRPDWAPKLKPGERVPRG